MKVHEYQAKDLLASYGITVPTGTVITTVEEAEEAAKAYETCVLKAQVHSGGRGKAGGVKLAKSPQQAKEIAEKMLGMCLVTKQTGPEGKTVRKILVTEAVEVAKEYYVSITGDSEHAGLVIVLSADGGTEIEETARMHPDRIIQIPVSAVEGFKRYEGLNAAKALGLSGENVNELITMLDRMVRLYLEKDCSLVEINPLVLTKEGHLLCLDAKVNFDDNALFRHADIAALRDPMEEDPKEVEAARYGLNYISLDGNIGCLVNGAGLAMATMDMIRHFGSEYGAGPANFLDVGGSATVEKVTAAFEILLADQRVEAILVNIFGGIMQCDVIAEGVVTAAKNIAMKVPLVVRLEGTHVEEGRRILKESGLPIISAKDMADGVKKAIEAAREYQKSLTGPDANE